MSFRNLQGRIAIVTGGATGIGAAIAKRFVNSGCRVVITGRRSDVLADAAKQIGCEFFTCDVSKLEGCESAVAHTLSLYGAIDILISNAGVLFEGDVLEQDLENWKLTLDTNITGLMNMSRAALSSLMKRRSGVIVNIASVASLRGGGGMAAYAASKAAVLGLSRSMAVDYGPSGVRVNTLCPGWVKTPMSDQEMSDLAKRREISVEEAYQATTRHLPLKRMAEPEEIASCVEFLASDASTFVTGAVLVADGGSESVDVGALAFSDNFSL